MKTTTARARYGLQKESGEWYTRPEFIPTIGVGSTDPQHRRGWAGESTARQFLRRHPELKGVGFRVRPIDD
jgi:hypothetical protein